MRVILSLHVTHTTGCVSSCAKPRLRHEPIGSVSIFVRPVQVQPWGVSRLVTDTKAAHSPRVTSNLLAANRRMPTCRRGPSYSERSFSFAREPITKLPAGITTISGHSGQSRKVCPGRKSIKSFLVPVAGLDDCGEAAFANAAITKPNIRIRIDPLNARTPPTGVEIGVGDTARISDRSGPARPNLFRQN